MRDTNSIENDFSQKITKVILENITNEQFGVSELADEVGMSRSNLLRKIKKLSNLSASQFINQVRLNQAKSMLKQNSLTVSEVSYQVGFSSVSYFIKCFREHYGYSPGKMGERDEIEIDQTPVKPPRKNRITILIGTAALLVVIISSLILYFKPYLSNQKGVEKSIAVLPFKNDSNDSTNVYLINGLMESVLTKLQNIKDLRVISRTSVEKYRNNPKLISEIAKELDVSYIVEGSGQKIGNQILLNIQLIEATTDKHLWAKQYKRDANDVFKLQMEVAKNIADEIEAIITPEEEKRINKVPTQNLIAYDKFLKGLDLFYQGNPESLIEAIGYFKKAIDLDNEFARAYADIAIAYYFLDYRQVEKKYTSQINSYAEKAFLLDATLTQSLIAKALFYINNAEYELAVTYLEKALEYNPNSALVLNILSDFYTSYIPNTEKYLEYALKGIKLDVAAHDSATASFIYLHISNAFIQSGFTSEAEMYINKSLAYNTQNHYSEYVKAYILYAGNENLEQLKRSLLETLSKDTTRLDVIQEVAKIYYYQRDYEGAYSYYRKFIAIKEALNLDIYRGENAKIGTVFSKMGLMEESEKYFEDYKAYCDNDKSIYKHLSLAMYYSHKKDTEKALEELQLFAQEDNYHYWTLLFLKIDPLIDSIKNHPEFKKILAELETKFWNNHSNIKGVLLEKKLI